MYAESVPVFLSNADVDIAIRLPDVLGGRVELRDMLAFCRNFRIKGIASLFLGGAPEPLCRELSNSGHAFLYYLSRSTDEGKATSRSTPFFDAIAARDLECARSIARTSRMTWNPDREYEDDFLYVQFLMKRFLLDAPPDECNAILRRYETILGGEPDVKRQVCTALAARQEEGFHHALCRWLALEEERYAQLVSSEAIVPEVAATEACLSVEGLALLRFAEAIGLNLAQDYLMIPAIARTRVLMTFDPDAWRRTLIPS